LVLAVAMGVLILRMMKGIRLPVKVLEKVEVGVAVEVVVLCPDP
jgi:hypothetical protein